MKNPCILPTRHSTHLPSYLSLMPPPREYALAVQLCMTRWSKRVSCFSMASNSMYHTVGVIYKLNIKTNLNRGATAAAQRFPTCRGQPKVGTFRLESWEFGILGFSDSFFLIQGSPGEFMIFELETWASMYCSSNSWDTSRLEKTQLFHSTHVETSRFGRWDGWSICTAKGRDLKTWCFNHRSEWTEGWHVRETLEIDSVESRIISPARWSTLTPKEQSLQLSAGCIWKTELGVFS